MDQALRGQVRFHECLVMKVWKTRQLKCKKRTDHTGTGYVESVGRNVKVAKWSDAVVLSFRTCRTCSNCSSGHRAYCLQFTALQFSGQLALTHAKSGETVAGGFFGQSCFSSLAIVHESTVVNVSTLSISVADLRLYAPLGCGIQTGAGTITNVANVKAGDVVVVLGLGGVGLTAIMVRARLSLLVLTRTLCNP